MLLERMWVRLVVLQNGMAYFLLSLRHIACGSCQFFILMLFWPDVLAISCLDAVQGSFRMKKNNLKGSNLAFVLKMLTLEHINLVCQTNGVKLISFSTNSSHKINLAVMDKDVLTYCCLCDRVSIIQYF